MKDSRRRFFKKAGSAVVACSMLSTVFANGKSVIPREESGSINDLFNIGIAGYTFVKFNLEQSLEMTERVDVKFLCIKDFHLPLDSIGGQIDAFHDKLKVRNITGYAVGPIYMRSETEVDKAFAYAKRVGVKLIIGVPDHELLPYVDKKVKEYNYKLAIHNHGVDDKRYPSLDSIFEKIKNLDRRIGICHDIGYSAQMGFSPAALTYKYGDRIYDMHIKDITKAAKSGVDCVIGRGVIDFPELIKALRATKYSGKCSIEMASADPLPVIAESVGFLKGVMKNA